MQVGIGELLLFTWSKRKPSHLPHLAWNRSKAMLMAEGQAVVSAFLQGLCETLRATIATSELPLLVSEELGRLLQAFLGIQLTTVEAAEEKPHKSKVLGAWLCELKDTAYDADDFLDRLALQPPVVNDMEEVMPQGRCLILSCTTLSLKHPAQKTASTIKAIRMRVDKLVKEQHKRFHLQPTSSLSYNRAGSLEEITPPEPRADEDREKMIQLLLASEETSSQVDLSLVSIVGEKGVGKTTLARIVYDDHRVAGHFQLKMWVTASEAYDTGRLLRSIAESAVGYSFIESTTMDEILDILKSRLVEKRYLLILDDVRNEMLEWEMLRNQLRDGLMTGSKMLITTENEEIATKIGLPSLSYHLQGLSPGDSWSLFRECVCLQEFEEIGKEIVVKLEGLPLAIRMVGCLLRSNNNLNYWKTILDADVWKSKPHELCGIPAALWLSYQHLPPHIKQCFAYCSVFPRDHKFDKESIVNMWMAQGLIQPQGVQMEDLGNEYFDYLLKRSFLQSLSLGEKSVMYERLVYSRTEISVDYARPLSLDISEEKYIMHALIHELSVSITLSESLYLSPVAKNMKKKVRHLSLQSDSFTINEVLDLGMLDNLRTLLFYRTTNSIFDYDALFMKLKCIRVLCLSDIRLKDLPKSIGNLKQLRCLDLTKTSIVTVPEDLCSLRNLQTLKLSTYSSNLQPLPRGISNLINLRHLKASGNDQIYKIGKLSSLQELVEFTVLNEDGHKIEELKDMTQLRGNLCISQLENVHTEEEAMEARLNEKEHIRKLMLEWTWDYTWDGIPIESNLAALEGLRPHPKLKDLTIRNNGGAKIPTWLEDGSLSSLETLEILECRNWDLSLLGQLKGLKTFRVDGLLRMLHVGLQNEGDDGQLFPCLRILDMNFCSSLIQVISLPLTLEAIRLHMVGLLTLPKLQQSRCSISSSSLASLHISTCPRLTTLQVGLLADQSQYQLQALHNLVIMNCTELVYLPDHGFSALMSLKTLRIEDCPKLRYKPVEKSSVILPSSLVDFKVIRSAALTNDSFFTSMGRLHSLSSMVIKGEPAVDEDRPPEHPPLTSLPWELLQHLKSLKELQIVDCEWLLMLGLQALVSLKRLKIAGCPKLEACSLPLDNSPMLLEYLEIEDSSLGILSKKLLQNLINLQELHIMECSELVNFPNEMDEGLQYLVSLKRLFIHQCNRLQTLPYELATILSLEELCITECSSIQSMPEKGLPASQSMLVIKDCRYLKQRCKKEGEDWPKISHVFYIEVDGRNVNEDTLAETPSSEEYVSVSTWSDWDFPHES